MSQVTACPVPPDSLLARFGGPESYRDCFVREVAGNVTLSDFIERFYASAPFLPERIVLKLVGRRASRADASRLARGETDVFGAWKVVERREQEILLESKETGTASWFAVEPLGEGTRLHFGSWVGTIGQSGWKAMELAHVWYSRALLAGV